MPKGVLRDAIHEGDDFQPEAAPHNQQPRMCGPGQHDEVCPGVNRADHT